jgi:hypothetical protein
MARLPLALLVFVLALTLPIPSTAAEPFRYPEGKSGHAELKYINGLPVLVLEGKPDEIGEAMGTLAVKPAAKLLDYPIDFLKNVKMEVTYPALVLAGKQMVPQFPADYLKEMEADVKATKLDRDRFVVANTLFDIKRIVGCSAVIVDGEHTTTGKPLFGRNLDFETLGYLNEYSLVVVCRPTGKHAFASITFPGLLGCLSGMNDAGLTVAVLEVGEAKDGSAKFDVEGVPYGMCFRRVLEECSTVAEAEKLLRSMKRTNHLNLAVCDPKGGAVFEITSKTLMVREPEAGLCAATNHFRSKELATSTECWRYPRLAKALDKEKLGLPEVKDRLQAVNQGKGTLQTMIFEPASLTLHLAIGKCPTTDLPLKKLELAPLFKSSEERGNAK